MNISKIISLVIFILFTTVAIGQNINYFFIDDTYQRSYFNPALNDEGKFSISSGLGVDFITNGPSIDDFIIDGPEGNLILSPANAISSMNDVNDIYGYSSVNTFDASIKLPFCRLSIGHAWKANGWMSYTKDLANFVTFGNGPFVGETLNLAPQIDYINYNEVYLGIQKSFGSLSIGVKAKRLNGVEAIKTENSKIDLTTSDDIYQLTTDTDFEMVATSAFSYTDIDDFNLNIQNFSFDNFFSNNGGWAFDLGASLSVGDKLELSLSVLDIGSINWDVGSKRYSSQGSRSFDGIDIANYINTDNEIVVLDSLESLLDITETSTEFSTTLPTQIYLGARFKINNLWTVGAIVQSIGNGDRRTNVLGLNATASIYNWLSAGVLYAAKTGNVANIGISAAAKLGPLTGFLSTDNILKVGDFDGTNSNFRAGLSLRI
ncbi:MAG: hypothetical protein ACJATI_000779 [Halioglobus sp.]|jgi:hypothetical protein